ncbi:MAG: hypothetical protein HRT93_03055 [Piscirickettsiaceae bacterium]|nr:hypothetical protein [Piscirickettsiaceae bacterium]
MENNHLSVATVEEKNRIDSEFPFLVCLEIDVKTSLGVFVETLYLVNNPEDFDYDGNTYVAFPFEIELGTEAGQEPNVTVTIQDISGAVKQRMNEYGGGVGFEVRVMVVSTADSSLPPEMVETFSVRDTSVNDFVVKWTLSSELHLLLNFPRRRQLRDRCPWAYKSVECGYAGAMSSCDFTLQGPNGCGVHENALNFGGFPSINNLS